jgi:hypothetical protein
MYQPNPHRHRDRSLGKSSTSSRLPTTSNVVELNNIRQKQQVKQLPRNNSIPAWLKSLLTIQKTAVVVASSVLGLSVILYAYTVYTQNSWQHQYGQLKRLQKQERQQGVMNENLKHKMAQWADIPGSGLVASSPERMVFIPSAAQRSTKAQPTSQLPKMSPISKLPLGY